LRLEAFTVIVLSPLSFLVAFVWSWCIYVPARVTWWLFCGCSFRLWESPTEWGYAHEWVFGSWFVVALLVFCYTQNPLLALAVLVVITIAVAMTFRAKKIGPSW